MFSVAGSCVRAAGAAGGGGAVYLRMVQQVGQDPQQGGGCRFHSGSKGLSRCHQDVIICYPLIF